MIKGNSLAEVNPGPLALDVHCFLPHTKSSLIHRKSPSHSSEFLLVTNVIIITQFKYRVGTNVITLTLFDHTNQAAVVQERRL